MPKVSVMMPVRNNRTYVGLAIKSVLAETFKDFELLVLDDESSDGTGEVVAKAIEGVKNARCVRAETRHGDAKARAALIAMSDADYILAADSDDVHIPDTLKERVDFLDANPSFAGIYGKLITINSAGQLQKNIMGQPYSRFAMSITQPGILLRRSDVEEAGGYLETGGGVGSYASDSYLWYRIGFKRDFMFFNDFVCYYRVHPTQQTTGATTAKFKADALKWISDEVLKIRPDLTDALRKSENADIAKDDTKAATIILGLLYNNLAPNDLDMRLKLCERAVQLSPDDYAPLFQSLPILIHRKDFQKALAVCKEFFLKFQKDPLLRMKAFQSMQTIFTAAKIPFDPQELSREIEKASSELTRISPRYFPKNGNAIDETLFSQN